MSSPSDTFTELVTTTLRRVKKEMTDNVSNHNALIRRMKDRGNIKVEPGGYEIQVNLEYAENGTYNRFAGYDELNTQASDVLTAAKYDWRSVAIHVMASGEELRKNSGEDAMIKLIDAKKKNAVHTAMNNMSVDLYSDGTLSNQINGLANLIQTDGTGTVGGFDASTETWWKNKFKELSGTDIAAAPNATNAAAMKADMLNLWLQCTRGIDKPDLIVCSHDFYVLYQTGENQLQRYTDADQAQSGFNSLKFHSADVIFDDNTNFATNAEKAYFINTDYLYLVEHKQARWTPDKEKKPTNMDAVIVPMYWMGNLVTTNRARQGVLFDAA